MHSPELLLSSRPEGQISRLGPQPDPTGEILAPQEPGGLSGAGRDWRPAAAEGGAGGHRGRPRCGRASCHGPCGAHSAACTEEEQHYGDGLKEVPASPMGPNRGLRKNLGHSGSPTKGL
ncbi:hypothetical protein NDU88_003114 [Pleurodeles waltl]|uniref:Uncharacterized protein n=1 Tax=Pleurodeles waltl TaxID=8319 RepID=A0AAV7MTC3_PLEWA|nr:hypothetical protein NDU88_003114 [Pleurodeles waltl]